MSDSHPVLERDPYRKKLGSYCNGLGMSMHRGIKMMNWGDTKEIEELGFGFYIRPKSLPKLFIS